MTNPVTWFQNHAPSWAVELVSGWGCVALALLARWLAGPVWGLAIVATILSLFYEFVLDKNPAGKWRDIGQRQVGIVAACLLRALL